jgi:hypothetical protein
MSNNANIERITFEEIQEFKNLNLYELPAQANPANLMILIYDTNTKSFSSGVMDASGNITITTDAILTRNVTVNTDDLPVNRGHVFLQGTAFTDVIDVLCNPPTDSSLSKSLDVILIEWGVATARTISHVFTQGTETDGEDAGTIVYYKDNVVIGSATDSTSITAESTVLYEVGVDTLNTTLPIKSFREGINMRVIFPIFIGQGFGPVATTPELQDLEIDRYIICDFPTIAGGFDYYWFSVEQGKTPLRWAEIDAAGAETGINKGDISTLFEAAGSFQHNGNTMSSYRTVGKKIFALRIKIEF